MVNKAIVDVKKLLLNAKRIKDKLGKTKFNAVVKADAYGHGAEMTANFLYPFVHF